MHGHTQTVISEVKEPNEFDNVYVERLFGDSLSTSFEIWVKDSVPTHRHNYHSEVVYVKKGWAKMKLNNEEVEIKEGDKIFIPKNTWHSVEVKSEVPLRVLSVQSPGYFGDDREFKYKSPTK